jgi:hypothetical protein
MLYLILLPNSLNPCPQLGGLIGFLGLRFTGSPLLIPPRRHHQPLFTIHTDPPESDTEPLDSLGTQPLDPLLGTQPLGSQDTAPPKPLLGTLPPELLGNEPLDSREES